LLEEPKEVYASLLITGTFINISIIVLSNYLIHQFIAFGNLPGWLFRVARRASLEVKRAADRRRVVEMAGARAEAAPTPDLSWREAVAILHEELDQLPAKYRDPLVLCLDPGDND